MTDRPVPGSIEEASALALAQASSPKAMLLGSGPRFARDVLTFVAVWKVAGLLAGIAASTLVSLVAWRWERKRERPGLMARISLGIVIFQALVGIAAGDPRVYLAQPVLVNGVYGLTFLVSALIGRPLAGVFASEMQEFPDEVKTSRTYRQVFGRISVAWGVFLLLRSVLRLLTLSVWSVEGYLVVNVATGVPLIVGMMTWSIWYGFRGFRRSEEWGWAFASA
jgi:intracellular septation protein A